MPLHFRHMEELENHYAMIGMAHVADDYRLYYDAVNEKGLGMAGLNFVGNAVYQGDPGGTGENVAQFEFIPWILSQCASVEEAKKMLAEMNLVRDPCVPRVSGGHSCTGFWRTDVRVSPSNVFGRD